MKICFKFHGNSKTAICASNRIRMCGFRADISIIVGLIPNGSHLGGLPTIFVHVGQSCAFYVVVLCPEYLPKEIIDRRKSILFLNSLSLMDYNLKVSTYYWILRAN